MRRFVWPVILGGAVVLFLISVLRAPSQHPQSAPATEAPRYTVRGAQWRRLDEDGEPVFEARAESIDYFDDRSARLYELEVSSLTGDGDPWRMTAPEGEAPNDFERLHLIGGVEGQGRWPDGEALRFKTPELWLNAETETIETEAAVQLDSRSRQAKGTGMKIDGELQKLWLLDNVELRYAP